MSKNEEMMNRIYAQISKLFLPPDLSPGAPPPGGFLSLMLPGEVVTPEDFDIKQGVNAEKKLYQRMNVIPSFNKVYLNSANLVSEVFESVLGAELPANDPVKSAEKKDSYDKAQKILADYGEIYWQKKETYDDAFIDYTAAKFEVEESPKNKKLQLALMRANSALEKAANQLSSTGKKQLVENALAEVDMYMKFSPVSRFAEAQEDYTNKANQPAKDLYGAPPITCYPEKWAADPDEISGWTNIQISQSSENAKTHNSTEVINSEWGANAFFVSASGSSSEVNNKMLDGVDFDNCEISFDVARVSIDRSWFNSNLMTIAGITMPNVKKGGFSAGRLDKLVNNPDITAPTNSYIPTQIIVARDIRISMTMTKNHAEAFSNAFSSRSNSRVGLGPFCVSHAKTVNRKSSGNSSSNNTETIEIEMDSGMQLIGVISTLLPQFPTADPAERKNNKRLEKYRSSEYTKLPSDMRDIFAQNDKVNMHRHRIGGHRHG